MLFTNHLSVNKQASVCYTSGGEAGGDGPCHQARYVRVFKVTSPPPYLKANNTDTTLHLQNLRVHGNRPQRRNWREEVSVGTFYLGHIMDPT